MTSHHQLSTATSRRIGARLDREWSVLRRQRRSIRTVRGWAASEPDLSVGDLFARVSDLDQILEVTRTDPLDRADRVLLQLVARARTEELAGRILLQRLLPPIISHSQRYGALDRNVEGIDHAVGAVWIVIQRYDVVHRVRHVAAALVSDAMWEAFRRQARRRSDAEVAVPLTTFDERRAHDSPADGLVELASALRDAAQAGVPDEHVDLMRDLAAADSAESIARARGVTTRTIRNRRARAIAKIRASLLAA